MNHTENQSGGQSKGKAKGNDPHILMDSNITEIKSLNEIPRNASGYVLIYWHQCSACHNILPAYNITAYLTEKTDVDVYALNGYVHRDDIEFTNDPETLKSATNASGKLTARGYPTLFRLLKCKKFERVDIPSLLKEVDSEMRISSIPNALIANASENRAKAIEFARSTLKEFNAERYG